jgi:hypothetical protein
MRKLASVCTYFEQEIAWADYCALMQAIELGIPTGQAELDLPPAADVRITDMASVLVDKGGAPRLQRMAFGFPPGGKGGPIFNFRSEGRSFADSGKANKYEMGDRRIVCGHLCLCHPVDGSTHTGKSAPTV